MSDVKRCPLFKFPFYRSRLNTGYLILEKDVRKRQKGGFLQKKACFYKKMHIFTKKVAFHY